MPRIERKLMVRTSVIGTLLTLAVLIINASGFLTTFDQWLYDQRAIRNQRYTPAPTDKLIHIDITDRALEVIGRFPWGRSQIAQILAEINRAGAKAIAPDILFTEPQSPEVKTNPDGSITTIDHDQLLAQTIAESDNVILATAFNIRDPKPEISLQIEKLLHGDLELSQDQVAEQLASITQQPRQFIKPQVADWYFLSRRRAMFGRIMDDIHLEEQTRQTLRNRLLPRTPRDTKGSPVLREFLRQHKKAEAAHLIQRFARVEQQDTPRAVPAIDFLPPIDLVAKNAVGAGFVDALPDSDGVHRSIPLWVTARGQLYPQLGFALACKMLNVDIHNIRLKAKRVVIPTGQGREIVIPVYSRSVPQIDQPVNMVMDIPWRGPATRWDWMYGPASHHLPITSVWMAIEIERKIAASEPDRNDAIKGLLELLDPSKLNQFINALASENHAAQEQIVEWTQHEVKSSGWQSQLDGLNRNDLTEKELVFLESSRALKHINVLKDQLIQTRTDLRRQIEGRATIIGWTAKAAVADFVPTPLHPRCPGSVVHGAIFNGIMTEDFWIRTPAWVTILTTITLGLLTTIAVACLAPLRSIIAALIIGGVYILTDGIIIFDHMNISTSTAGPISTIMLVWPGCMLYRFIAERAERTRITRRFRSYVDPALVDYVLEHPEQAHLDGQIREMTVVFTDLAGFTSLSEQLRERTVGILNEYMDLMVPIIRQHNGYVNKFLGDGIMFFYGAPKANAHHATDAALTALEMHRTLIPFNAKLIDRGLPGVSTRVGIASGNMVVGDAGSPDASDYTVLGDVVNLASRLESANKFTGTSTLMNYRTAMFVEDQLLLKPIGRLQVVGKIQSVMTFEPVCPMADATDDQKLLVAWTDEMINTYITGNFDKCIEQTNKLDNRFNPTQLTLMYRRISEQYIRTPPKDVFLGQIVLEDK